MTEANSLRPLAEIAAEVLRSQQQDSSGNQTILWLSHLRRYGNSPLSHVGTPSGTGINPQILLRRRCCIRFSLASSASSPH